MIRRLTACVATLATSALLLTACSGTDSGNAASTTTPGLSSVVHVVNGPLGDSSFFDDAERGIQRLAAEGHRTQTVQSEANNPAQWKANTESVSGKWDLVVVGSSQMVDVLTAVAPTYPEQKYIIYDDVVTAPNVASVTFKQNEGSFLAGVLAALATTDTASFPKASGSKVVGMVGGMDGPVVTDFLVGFTKGAQSVDPSIQVKVAYTGSWSDSLKAYDLATSMYTNDKADVVYQVAGPAGTGVLKAAAAADRYAIGVDANQNALQPGHVLASMLKGVGEGVHAAVDAADAGTLQFGATTSYGLANKGVALTFEDNSGIVPQSAQDRIDDYAQQVIDGRITVPSGL